MLKVYGFLTKREGMETEAFIEHYEKNHVPLILSLAPLRSCTSATTFVRGDEFNREEDTIDFDVIRELVFADRAGFIEWVEKLSVDAIATEEEKFVNRSRTRAYVIEEHATSG